MNPELCPFTKLLQEIVNGHKLEFAHGVAALSLGSKGCPAHRFALLGHLGLRSGISFWIVQPVLLVVVAFVLAGAAFLQLACCLSTTIC